MKKLLFVFPIVVLLAAGCGAAQQANNQTPIVQNTNRAPVPAPTATSTTQQQPQATTTPTNTNVKTYTNSSYGVGFKYPSSDTFTPDTINSPQVSYFVNQTGQVIFGTVQIPQSVYPKTNFVDGDFVASVSPNITSSAACNQFEIPNRPISTIKVNGITYSEITTGGAAAGTDTSDNIYHAYKNNFCYEFIFSISTFNRGNLENPSSVNEFTASDKLLQSFLSGISFSTPTVAPTLAANINPAITSFTASSPIAYSDSINSGITFLWSTQGVDYVQLFYSCPGKDSQGLSDLTVVSGATPQCQIIDPPSSPNYSPNASTTIIFGNNLATSPVQASIPVILTLEPFINGTGYPKLSKTLNISVTSPFYNSKAPTSYNGMSLSLTPSANSDSNYRQGGSIKISWVNTKPDCVNLFLVQDDGQSGANVLYQIADDCVSPGSNGSYTWTIPNNYSGTGFHILGESPGGTNAISAPFTITTQ